MRAEWVLPTCWSPVAKSHCACLLQRCAQAAMKLLVDHCGGSGSGLLAAHLLSYTVLYRPPVVAATDVPAEILLGFLVLREFHAVRHVCVFSPHENYDTALDHLLTSQLLSNKYGNPKCGKIKIWKRARRDI